MKMKLSTKMMMEPNIHHWTSSDGFESKEKISSRRRSELYSSTESSISDVYEKSQGDVKSLKTREDEKNLFELPPSLRVEYRPLPLLLNAISAIFSMLLAIRLNTINGPIRLNRKPIANIKILLTTFVSFMLSTMILQDTLYPTSRISMETILRNKWLPSPLSKYSVIKTKISPKLVEDETMDMPPVGIHYLEFENEKKTNDFEFDAIHFNHGFGASSLSWLPAIPTLVDRLHSRIGIAHDAAGFGFTEKVKASGRRGGLIPYSSSGNAAFGNLLVNRKLTNESKKRICLFGHSMGCASTLKMAMTLPSDVEKTVVLVAPALVGDFTQDIDDEKSELNVSKSVRELKQRQPGRISLTFGATIAAIRRVIFDPFIIYGLRRAVGRKGFWSNGLKLAWGDPLKLNDSDILRFQWPAIGKGWESGILAFTRSRIAAVCSYDGGEIKLLKDVLDCDNTKVIIIQGLNDPIVPMSMTRKIYEHFGDRIVYLTMEGGHDPFEEEVDDFVNLVANEIKK